MGAQKAAVKKSDFPEKRKAKRKMTKTQMKYEHRVRSFLSNVNKLDMRVHRQTHDAQFGTVVLKKAAWESRSGKRVFAVKGSPVLKSGSYSLGGLRAKLLGA